MVDKKLVATTVSSLGLHSDWHKALSLEQRCGSQRHNTHGQWPQMCYGHVRNSEGQKQTSSYQGAEGWTRKRNVRRWKRAKVEKPSARSQRGGTRHEQGVYKKGNDKNKSEGKGAEARSGRRWSACSTSSGTRSYGSSRWSNHHKDSRGSIWRSSRIGSARNDWKRWKIRALIQERKTTAKHETERIREISKEIKKYIREHKRTKRQERIQKILEKVKGTRNIPNIKSVKRRILIPKVRDKEGEIIKTRQGIANVFAKFYEDFFEGEGDLTGRDVKLNMEGDDKEPEQNNFIKEFTIDEIQDAIDRLK